MSATPDVARLKRDLADLVAIDSQNPPGHELGVAEKVRSLLGGEGFEVAVSEYEPGRASVELTLENGPGPVFAFNTHLDVVPAGEGWTSAPFALREDAAAGRLYGRGACDAKGPLAAQLEAMRMLAADRSRWSGTLKGVFVADEEVASAGARAYARTKPKIDFVVVGEPTSNTTYSAHKGSLRPIVRVHGVAAHSGTPHLGENAIMRAGELTALIARHHAEVVCQCRHALVGSASLTVTRISGGHADNVVPEACDLLVDRRLVPGEDEAAATADLNALFERARRETGLRAEIIGFKPTTGGATQTASDAPIVTAALAACAANGVATPGPFGFQGACDLVHFRSLGATGIVVGPGDLAVAHKPDEFVPIDELVAASLIYRDIALRLLG